MTDSWPRRPSPEWVEEQIVALLPHGAGPQQLSRHAPKLIDALRPKESHSDLNEQERAIRVIRMINEAIEDVDREHRHIKPAGQALRYLFGLTDQPSLKGAPLSTRITYASRTHEIQPSWFRRRYFDMYVGDLADVLYDRLALEPRR